MEIIPQLKLVAGGVLRLGCSYVRFQHKLGEQEQSGQAQKMEQQWHSLAAKTVPRYGSVHIPHRGGH